MEERPFSAKRWTDIPKPEVIGHVEFTKEQMEENDRRAEAILRQYGIIKEEQRVRNSKIVDA